MPAPHPVDGRFSGERSASRRKHQCGGSDHVLRMLLCAFRCLVQEDIPATAGLMRSDCVVIAPPGSVLNARPPAAGSRWECRDVAAHCRRASCGRWPRPFRIEFPLRPRGTMQNNLTIGGMDSADRGALCVLRNHRGRNGSAADERRRLRRAHTHMTNSLNTPAEALEYAYPLRVRHYGLRRGSGGAVPTSRRRWGGA